MGVGGGGENFHIKVKWMKMYFKLMLAKKFNALKLYLFSFAVLKCVIYGLTDLKCFVKNYKS